MARRVLVDTTRPRHGGRLGRRLVRRVAEHPAARAAPAARTGSPSPAPRCRSPRAPMSPGVVVRRRRRAVGAVRRRHGRAAQRRARRAPPTAPRRGRSPARCAGATERLHARAALRQRPEHVGARRGRLGDAGAASRSTGGRWTGGSASRARGGRPGRSRCRWWTRRSPWRPRATGSVWTSTSASCRPASTRSRPWWPASPGSRRVDAGRAAGGVDRRHAGGTGAPAGSGLAIDYDDSVVRGVGLNGGDCAHARRHPGARPAGPRRRGSMADLETSLVEFEPLYGASVLPQLWVADGTPQAMLDEVEAPGSADPARRPRRDPHRAAHRRLQPRAAAVPRGRRGHLAARGLRRLRLGGAPGALAGLRGGLAAGGRGLAAARCCGPRCWSTS